ncbi:hypothetical protein BH18ACT15_BH18ACT15_09150 [soil metagenome]
MDRIVIERLRAETHVGATEEERGTAQHVLIDVVARCDLTGARASDSLADTVDYGLLVAAITRTVESSDVALLERLAEKIALVAAGHPRVTGVTVTVEKEKPPLPQDVGRVAVSVDR